MEILGDLIRQLRLERNLTQAELGALPGVQKAQVSKLENNATNVSMGTLLSVLKASNAKAYLQVDLPSKEFAIATAQ
ncbi:MAG: helix-turn-helix domain-containing protein [Saprospiraceae bacterium]|nr:helix-turn-helix domain-containing protein [Saprospiraceae bacterium]MDW8483206.1 helix-turn-helix transcriptional regulator [Saprospiraceae bacterium]